MTARQPQDVLDERATAWLDETMSAEERAIFEAEMAEDPALSGAVHELEAVVRELRQLPQTEAPPDFLKAVQSRIRRRTRGRYFGFKVKYRFPYEAVVNGVLLGLLMAVYIISMPTGFDVPELVTPASVHRTTAMPAIGAAILVRYGPVTVVSATDDGADVVYEVRVAADRLAALEREIGLYPDVQLLEVTDVAGQAGMKTAHVRAVAREF